MEGKTSSAVEDDWTPNTIQSVKQKMHSTRSMNNNGPEFFTITALVNNRPIKFIIDSGSSVTLIPKSQFNRITPLRSMETEYRDVNVSRIHFEGKTTAKVETNGTGKKLEILVSTKKTNPLLGLEWMKKLGITLEPGKSVPEKHQVKEDLDVTTLKTKFKKVTNENHTVNGLVVKIQLKEVAENIITAERRTHIDSLATKRNR